MKRLILAISIMVLAAINLQAQIDSTFVPDYGIELEGYSETKRFATDTLNLTTEIKFMSPLFQENRVIFFYDVKTYNDTLLVKRNKQYRIELPLNVKISGKYVYEWLNDLYSVQDTAILKGLSEKLYYYDLMNK